MHALSGPATPRQWRPSRARTARRTHRTPPGGPRAIFAFVSPMSFLSDEEVRHIASQLPAQRDEREGLAPPTLVLLRWLRQLLEDRQERSTVILGLSRHLHHLRERLRDAGTYFDKLA